MRRRLPLKPPTIGWHLSVFRFSACDERGFTYAFIALLLPVFLGLTGLVIEVGEVLEVRRQLQTAVDAAALAGAQDLPNSPTDAHAFAQDYVNWNREAMATTAITVSTTYYENDTITVTALRNIPLVLMPFVGYPNAQDVAATATAIVGVLGVDDCIIPVGVVDLNGGGAINGFGYTFGQTATLKFGAQAGFAGNFQPLDIYGPGANIFRNAIEGNCTDVSVSVNTYVDTETGDMVGPTIQGFDNRIGSDTHTFDEIVTMQPDGTALIHNHADGTPCPRIAVVPIVPEYDMNGKKPILIEAFAHMFIESWTKKKETTPDGQTIWAAQVTGRFIDNFLPGAFSEYTPTGSRVVRLMR